MIDFPGACYWDCFSRTRFIEYICDSTLIDSCRTQTLFLPDELAATSLGAFDAQLLSQIYGTPSWNVYHRPGAFLVLAGAFEFLDRLLGRASDGRGRTSDSNCYVCGNDRYRGVAVFKAAFDPGSVVKALEMWRLTACLGGEMRQRPEAFVGINVAFPAPIEKPSVDQIELPWRMSVGLMNLLRRSHIRYRLRRLGVRKWCILGGSSPCSGKLRPAATIRPS